MKCRAPKCKQPCYADFFLCEHHLAELIYKSKHLIAVYDLADATRRMHLMEKREYQEMHRLQDWRDKMFREMTQPERDGLKAYYRSHLLKYKGPKL